MSIMRNTLLENPSRPSKIPNLATVFRRQEIHLDRHVPCASRNLYHPVKARWKVGSWAPSATNRQWDHINVGAPEAVPRDTSQA